jgi:hypothetical protein
MASQFHPLNAVLSYSDNYSYPLTAQEVWFWQIQSTLSRPQVAKYLSSRSSFHGFYYLHRSTVNVRASRVVSSASKWRKTQLTAKLLRFIPTIQAIFVTGSLAMSNSPPDDDIDLMIVTAPNTLWLTRLLVITVLTQKGLRRPPYLPEHSSPKVCDKICDNLYLDGDNLQLTTHNLYTAHEILQAKCIFERSNIHSQFLKTNSWVGDYLPIAYRQTLKSIPKPPICNKQYAICNILWPINLLLFSLQYLYMLPRMTSERVSLGYAFFHPKTQTS